ncbi:alpha/beta-hydrolase [Fomitopsis serialis]|uniref:alpha/beta-hydrolase n=1 Tax=Fomitopsis serialis TaxID=139415 RepID=UPI0020071ED3|nr:alpha/beta-hydrolase [Neoantrodia serialis]KAH9938091.1 alpha/beta-hydrolase [Neoantrodia serialis]
MLYASPLRLLWAVLPLWLIWHIAAAPTDVPSAASFYVRSLPGLHQDVNHPLHMFSGHLPSDPNATNVPDTEVTAHLFFLMIKNRRMADKERLMFWFNGGPGCSSFDGLMMEVGPWRLDGKGGLNVIEGGWEEYTTMVYVDQPAGAGFSYTSSDHYLHELSDAAAHMVEFLKNFYDVFPEYKDVDTYLAGESFAGQYIPYFADAILNSTLNMPLRGAAIGNGWIDGRHQYPSFLQYAVKHGLIEEKSDEWKHGKEATDNCMKELDKHKDHEPVKVNICEGVMHEVIKSKTRKVNGKEMCLNIYDVRLQDESPACGMNWPPDLKHMYTYLQRPEVVRAIHASEASQTWTECRGTIHHAFNTASSPSAITVIPRVLAKIPILLFAGDQDLICNYVGIENLIQAMSWNGATGLGTVKTEPWSVNGTSAGTWVSSRNLTYAKIFNASHMVGFDAPHITHDMILRFMGANFSMILDGSARIPSAVGDNSKPIPELLGNIPSASATPSETPEQDKAKWEAYYNAGSAAMVLAIISIFIAGFIWWRYRRSRLRGLQVTTDDSTAEENIPLATSMTDVNGHGDRDDEAPYKQAKGKERAQELPNEGAIFSIVGDDEDLRTPRTGQ